MQPSSPEPIGEKPRRSGLLVTVAVAVLSGIALVGLLIIVFKPKTQESQSVKREEVAVSETQDTQAADTTGAVPATALRLDATKSYGAKYADGLLPVGDDKYTTVSAEKGKVFICRKNFVPAGQAGAQTRGPWFVGTDTWDINKKAAVRGSVKWVQKLSSTVQGDKRVITTNDLPDHITGEFPVSNSDPAAKYDRNPNQIQEQDYTYTLSAAPAYGEPQCMGGEVGVMLTGVALFNAFDAGGRDAGAWEVQDACEGHPQGDGEYHYHTLSSCINDVSVRTVIGFALDGFPITGPSIGPDNYLTSSDLDECHGITSTIMLDGKEQESYHYVMTMDFPYSASCFRSAAANPPNRH